jgi:hypothetical protein
MKTLPMVLNMTANAHLISTKPTKLPVHGVYWQAKAFPGYCSTLLTAGFNFNLQFYNSFFQFIPLL